MSPTTRERLVARAAGATRSRGRARADTAAARCCPPDAERGARDALLGARAAAARRRARRAAAASRSSGISIGSRPSRAQLARRARRDDRADGRGRRSRRWSTQVQRATRTACASSTRAARSTCRRSPRCSRELDVLVTGDTGPMHLAAAWARRVVALFGPSNPRRYGPLGDAQRVLRVDLPCSPCGQVRLPPERCRGHVPDCMDGITRRRRRRAPRLLDARPSRDADAPTDDGRRSSASRRRAASRPYELASLLTPALRERRASRPIAWIKRLRLVPLRRRSRCASGSRIAAIRCGGSPSSICTRCGGSTRAVAAILALEARASSAHAPARIDGRRRATASTRDAARAFGARTRRCRSSRARRGDVARRGTRWPSYLVGLTARAVAPAPARPPRAARRPAVAAFVHTAFWRDGAATTARAGKLHRPGARRGRARLGAGDLTCVGVGPRRNFRARRWWDPRDAPSAAAPRGHADRAARAATRGSPSALDALAAARRAGGRAHHRRRHPRGRASFAAAISGRCLRRELAGVALRAVAVVRARDGRSRRRARRAVAATSSSPTPRPAAGAARSCSRRAAAACRRSACSTASSTATG